MLTASVHVINPFLLQEPCPMTVVKDFTPITLLASGPLLVSTTPSVPANDLKEFFDLVRKDPQKYTFATIEPRLGRATSRSSCSSAMPARHAGRRLQGHGPALDRPDGRHSPVARRSDAVLAAAGAKRKIKALAITSLKRMAIAPDIPTVAESGMKGFDFVSWYGLWAPKGLPADL